MSSPDQPELARAEFSRMEQTVDGFRQVLQFEPGYNDTVPRRYGKHSMGLRFVLIGDRGATQFAMGTGWVPDEKSISPGVWDLYPMAQDLGWHWSRCPYGPGSDGWYVSDSCQWLPGECTYDGSGLAAEPVLVEFITEGPPAVWRALRRLYDEMAELERSSWPEVTTNG